MIPTIAEKLEGKVSRDYVFVRKDGFEMEVYFTTTGGNFDPQTGTLKRPNVLVTTKVPSHIQMYAAYEIMSAKKYEMPTFVFAESQQN